MLRLVTTFLNDCILRRCILEQKYLFFFVDIPSLYYTCQGDTKTFFNLQFLLNFKDQYTKFKI